MVCFVKRKENEKKQVILFGLRENKTKIREKDGI
jgi:hypothetical protein